MINQLHSYKDYTQQSLTHLSASEFSNSTIVGSCFYKESTDWNEIFPIGTTNVEFKRCNLDNCILPDNSTIDDECSYRLMVIVNE